MCLEFSDDVLEEPLARPLGGMAHSSASADKAERNGWSWS